MAILRNKISGTETFPTRSRGLQFPGNQGYQAFRLSRDLADLPTRGSVSESAENSRIVLNFAIFPRNDADE